MSSIRRPESIASLIKMSTTTLSFPSSVVNIGAMQYKNITSLILSTSFVGVGGLDAVLQTNSVYYVYAVASNNSMTIIGSTNSSLPSGFTQARQVGSFTTDSSGYIAIPPLNVNLRILNASAQLSTWDLVMADVSIASFTATLPPNPSVGNEVQIIDAKGLFSLTRYVTLARNGQPIKGTANDFDCNQPNKRYRAVFVDATYGWDIHY